MEQTLAAPTPVTTAEDLDLNDNEFYTRTAGAVCSDSAEVFVASESGLDMDRFYDTLLLLGGARGWVALECIGRVLDWEHELLEEYAGFWQELDMVEIDGDRVSFNQHVVDDCASDGFEQSPAVMSR